MKRYVIVSLLMIVAIAACTEQPPSVPEDDEVIPEPSAELTQQSCDAAGGKWNDCGSPCAGTGADVCIQVCEAQCQCGGIAGFKCPPGFSCRLSGKIADEMGKCVEVTQHERKG